MLSTTSKGMETHLDAYSKAVVIGSAVTPTRLRYPFDRARSQNDTAPVGNRIPFPNKEQTLTYSSPWTAVST